MAPGMAPGRRGLRASFLCLALLAGCARSLSATYRPAPLDACLAGQLAACEIPPVLQEDPRVHACGAASPVPEDCVGAAQDLLDGLVLPQDPRLAAALLGRACAARDPRGCVGLGKLYERGQGVPRDLVRAVELYQEACHEHETEGCDRLHTLERHQPELHRLLASAAASHRAACDSGRQGGPAGCYRLAQLYRDGLGVRRSTRRADALYLKTCTAGLAIGCYRHGQLSESGELGRPARAVAADSYRRACEAGEPGACVQLVPLAGALAKPLLQPASSQDVEAWLVQACQLGLGRGCYDLGGHLLLPVLSHAAQGAQEGPVESPEQLALETLKARERAQRREQAAAAYARGCDLGFAEACRRLADMYRGVYIAGSSILPIAGAPWKEDPEAAVSWAAKGCARGSSHSCLWLFEVAPALIPLVAPRGFLSRLAPGFQKAAALACRQGHRLACAQIEGLLLIEIRRVFGIEGTPVPTPSPGRRALTRACDRGDALLCYVLGRHLARGDHGLPYRPAEALAPLQKACDRRMETACAELARLYRRGEGANKDIARSATLLDRACQGGDAAACHELAWMLRRGIGMAPDEMRETELIRKACQLGHRPSCQPPPSSPPPSSPPPSSPPPSGPPPSSPPPSIK
jgi:TPR repeat protein